MKKSVKWTIAQKAELKWWQHYLGKQSKESYYRWKRQYWYHFLEQLGSSININPSSKILDAGCGPAGIFTILNEHVVTAIDPLVDHYKEQLAYFEPLDFPYVTFKSTALELFDEGDHFDFIFCINAINHVNDIKIAVHQLRKNLKKSGTLVLTIDTHHSHFLKKLFRLLPFDILHPHQNSLKDYENMLIDEGFSILESKKLKPGKVFDYWAIVAAEKP